MALTHNSTLAKSEPSWGNVDKTALPRNAYADMGDADSKSSWRYPHHHVESGKIGGKHDLCIKGDMYLSREGLKTALQDIGNGDIDSEQSAKRHLISHANAIGMDKKETAALLNMSVGSLMDFLNNDNNNNNINDNNKMGGENIMGMTYEELEAKAKDLEKTVSEKVDTITDMKTDAETLATTVKAATESLESEIVKYEKSEGDLKDEIDDLKKDAKDNAIFITAGKQFIEDTKAEIHKISVQVDGNDYNKDLVDKQLVAFGIDLEALNSFKANLENRRAKLLKTGEIKPEGQKSEKTTAQEEYDLGQKIGAGNVIPIRKAN